MLDARTDIDASEASGLRSRCSMLELTSTHPRPQLFYFIQSGSVAKASSSCTRRNLQSTLGS
jgi:hypothetical protein